jgi:hypothetical protein
MGSDGKQVMVKLEEGWGLGWFGALRIWSILCIHSITDRRHMGWDGWLVGRG